MSIYNFILRKCPCCHAELLPMRIPGNETVHCKCDCFSVVSSGFRFRYPNSRLMLWFLQTSESNYLYVNCVDNDQVFYEEKTNKIISLQDLEKTLLIANALHEKLNQSILFV